MKLEVLLQTMLSAIGLWWGKLERVPHIVSNQIMSPVTEQLTLTQSDVLHHRATLGPYTANIITFLDTTKYSGEWRPRRAEVCCHLGQCKFPSRCSGSQLICEPPTDFWFCIYHHTLHFKFFFGIMMEGTCQPTSCVHTSSGDGGDLQGYWCGRNLELDNALQTVF